MADGYKVTPDQLKQGSSQITKFAEQIGVQLDNTRKQAAGLAEGWTGQAAGNFANAMKKFDDAAKSQQGALKELATLLDKAGTAYAQTEADIQRAFQQ